jgi:PPOX class probable F420-dependent enzyme
MRAVGAKLSDLARRLLDARTFATLATVMPDGRPHSTVVWVKRDGDDVLFSSIRGMRKTRNIERDPRVSLVVFDPANPYAYVEVRGTVSVTEEGGRELINELSHKYEGRPYTFDPPEAVRLIFRLTPTRVVGR